ncbi:HEAT repeat domain-containing protein [Curtobacterium flaccumfaciens]|uniref:HEAT repeat domain-containing protein n=1 Tax=Curtobacterium flaccumfaciens TaxID=2035 RepID=UPI001BDE3059|nr:HEAT repeat domain-containing protein [Curtobacterium flaccumfaciens]MBT1597040.1 HEAT repeat domain-containing protein [Curtobacterium flaccumfaciens pv. flaccumfaciens]
MTTLTDALTDPRSSARLQAVMAAGTTPDPSDLEVLVAQCAVEPDFFVRDMLTWALTRHRAEDVVARVLPELERPESQARSQALHTLSKIGDPDAWPAVRPLLGDQDDEVLRAAWRTAVALVPDDERASLARTLAVQLGVGDRDRRLSLSRALVGLGEDTVAPVLAAAADRGSDVVREHVRETERLLHDPGVASEHALERARREVALGRTRSVKG